MTETKTGSRKKGWKVLLVVIAVLVVGGRMYAKWEARRFGADLGGALSMVGKEGFADTQALREFFESRDMASHEKRVRAMGPLGMDYAKRIEELKTGMIYLSQQASLPEGERMKQAPGIFFYLFSGSAQSDEALGRTALDLVNVYLLKL